MTEMLVARRVHRPTTLGYKPVAMQPSDSGGSFSLDFGPFSGTEIGVSSGCLGKTSSFKIIMIDDVTLWSKLESTVHG